MTNAVLLSSKTPIAWITKEGVTLCVCYSCSWTENIRHRPLSGPLGMCCRGFWYHPAHLSWVPRFLFCFKRVTSISAPNAALGASPQWHCLMTTNPGDSGYTCTWKICLSSKEINRHFLDVVVREETSIRHPTEETLAPIDRGSDWEKDVTIPTHLPLKTPSHWCYNNPFYLDGD